MVGSRAWKDPAPIREYLAGLSRWSVIVSGGARGADQLAEKLALERGLVVCSIQPPWQALGRRAGPLRNLVIADVSDRCVAFWDGESRGTLITIEAFERLMKPVTIIHM